MKRRCECKKLAKATLGGAIILALGALACWLYRTRLKPWRAGETQADFRELEPEGYAEEKERAEPNGERSRAEEEAERLRQDERDILDRF